MRNERALVGGVEALTDTGAQYITQVLSDDGGVRNAALHSELQRKGLLVPVTGVIEGGRSADGAGQNFMCPLGLDVLVSSMISDARATLVCGRRAQRLRLAEGGCRWEVSAADQEKLGELFDAVVLTPPAPDMLGLLDNSECDAQDWLDPSGRSPLPQLAALQYSSRYALSLFFSAEHAPLFAEKLPWIARYVNRNEDDTLVFLSHDAAKRDPGSSGGRNPPTLLAHSSVPFGLARIREGTSDAAVTDVMLASVRKLLPWLPEPEEHRLHLWRSSQVRYPLEGLERPCAPLRAAGTAAVDSPPLVLAGDAFSSLGSRFDGCVESGESAAETLTSQLLGEM